MKQQTKMIFRAALLFIAFLLSAILFGHCHQPIEPTTKSALARVDLESDFQNDSVKVEYDSQILFVGRVTTNYSVAAAWASGPLHTTENNHTITLSVYTDNATNQITTFIKDTVVVAARYNHQTKRIDFVTYNFWVMRR